MCSGMYFSLHFIHDIAVQAGKLIEQSASDHPAQCLWVGFCIASSANTCYCVGKVSRQIFFFIFFSFFFPVNKCTEDRNDK